MALDAKRVIDQLRQAAAEAEIWNVGQGNSPEVTPEAFFTNYVRPHFGKVLDRLGEVQVGHQDGTIHLAAERLESAFWKHQLPADFFGEELQGVYRDAWFATGHLVRASGNRLDGLRPTEKAALASAGACVLLDPTVDRVFGVTKPDPQAAVQILSQVARHREREAGDRGR